MDSTGGLIWAALGNKTMELIQQNIEVGEVHDDEEIITMTADMIDDFIQKQKDPKKTAKKIEIDLVRKILNHSDDPKFQKLGEKLERLREKHEQGLINSVSFFFTRKSSGKENASEGENMAYTPK